MGRSGGWMTQKIHKCKYFKNSTDICYRKALWTTVTQSRCDIWASISVCDKEVDADYKNNDVSEKKKHKIVIISDSVAGGSALEFKHNQDKFFEVRGFCKP
jgi:hypothetical protein